MQMAALEDAIEHTTNNDRCGECAVSEPCENHLQRALRAELYRDALDEIQAEPEIGAG